MYEKRERKLIFVDNTNFIYNTNFSGDPDRDNYGSDTRKGNIIIPSYEQAKELMDEGFNVRSTKPRPGEEEDFEPTYFVSVIVNYDSKRPPRVYLITGDAEPVLLDEESIAAIDTAYVRNVNIVLNPYYNQRNGRKSLYVTTMYVEQDIEEDPYASRYFNRNRRSEEEY